MNIWGTLEMTCAAMGLPYEEYVDLHRNAPIDGKGHILSRKGFCLIVDAFDNELTEYYKDQDKVEAPYKLEPLL